MAHRPQALGDGRTLRFERDLQGIVTAAYVSHDDAEGRTCLTRLAIEDAERGGGTRRSYRLVRMSPATLEGPPIVCRCGERGRIAEGRWIDETASPVETEEG